ncbi:MAG: hypothetical protein JNL83_13690 [Myxococcales bacterium]|nr:hypothetical protein [Myxococcales bacterium]
MRRAVAIGLAVAALGCGRSHDGEEELGTVAFKALPGWQRSDTRARNTQTAVFTPAVNSRKESITVIRTELGPVAAKYTPEMMSSLLLRAHSALAQAKSTPVARLTTAEGLTGVRVEVDFVPPSLTQSYHRVHVVLAQGTALVHVLYTAAAPEAEQAMLQQVVNTLHEES